MVDPENIVREDYRTTFVGVGKEEGPLKKGNQILSV